MRDDFFASSTLRRSRRWRALLLELLELLSSPSSSDESSRSTVLDDDTANADRLCETCTFSSSGV